MRNLLLSTTALLCLFSAPAFAQDAELDLVNKTAFQSVDANQNGLLSRREVEHFRELVMLSMDVNDDDIVTLAEYMAWDMGWVPLAKNRGQMAKLRKARVEVFNAWDSNGDGSLSASEQNLSQANDFYVASNRSGKPMDLEGFSKELRIIAAMNQAVSGAEPVILINAFTVPEGKEAQAVAFWEEAAKFMREQPGYLSTALHQTLLPDAKFGLVNVARWESIDAFKQASKALRTESGLKPVEGLVPNPSLYKIIRTD